MEQFDILIVGAGAAGISAAKAAHDAGCRSILLVDRKASLGGVLLQCAHRGFGDNQNGPEYIDDLINDFPDEIVLTLNTTVLSVSDEKKALLAGKEYGQREVHFSQLILATGCREIPLGALQIAGDRPKEVYTAGEMQERMNIYGIIPEGPAVVLGSGDIGLVMAKHLLDAGLDVTVVEQKGCYGGMKKNQLALRGSAVKTHFNSTIREIIGEKHLEACNLIDGTRLPCKTLLIAAGLVPERELVDGLESHDWLQFCGNSRRVHPIVESVVTEGKKVGLSARKRIIR